MSLFTCKVFTTLLRIICLWLAFRLNIPEHLEGQM